MNSRFPFLSSKRSTLHLEIILAPRASRSVVLGVYDQRLKIAVTAPPVDGKANKVLIEFLSRMLECPKGQISIVRGERARRKVVAIEGLGIEQITAQLDEVLNRG